MSTAAELYAILKEIFLVLDDGDRQLFGKFNLTVPRFYALFHLSQHPGQSLSQLSDRMLCDKSNVTRIIKGLENDDLVRRSQHETDRRTLRLYLTEQGESVFNEVEAIHTAYNELRFSYVRNVNKENLFENLSVVHKGLQEQLVGLTEILPTLTTAD